MDEYIKQRQAVLNDICQKRYGCDYEGDCPSCAYTTPLAAAPAANVVPVVRCEKCAHHEDEEPGMVYCQQIVGGWVPNEFFCAEGEEQNDRRKSMGRLISADALIKNHFSDEHNIALSYANKMWMRQIINAEPTVDAVPRELFDKLLKGMCEMCFMWGDGLCPFCEWKKYRTDANEPNGA